MKSITIITHCWSGDKVPIYHRLLQMQLSSLVKYHNKDISTTVVVCYSLQDTRTCEVVNWFAREVMNLPHFFLIRHPLSECDLFRRAIGRNQAGKASSSDVVWFTDCDHLFLKDCLPTAMNACLESEKNMVFPKHVNIHKEHSWGDVLIDKLEQLPLHVSSIDPEHFTKRLERKAIGGLQIVKGDWVREHGYLDETSWMTPMDPKKGFTSFRDDVMFRKQVGESEAVEILNLFRVRHSRCGYSDKISGNAKNK